MQLRGLVSRFLGCVREWLGFQFSVLLFFFFLLLKFDWVVGGSRVGCFSLVYECHASRLGLEGGFFSFE